MSKLKAAATSNKGQKSLFSFFKKPEAAAVVPVQAPPLTPQPMEKSVDTLKPSPALPDLTPCNHGCALVDKRIEVCVMLM